MDKNVNQPFYKDGLKFECQRCSACCRYEHGYVFLSETDIKNLLKILKIKKKKFISDYCTKVDVGGVFRLSLKEKSNYDCIFWENGGCRVYEGRPLQCRSFPFWASNMRSEEEWDSLAGSCPGINKGKLHSREEIEEWLYLRRLEKLVDFDKETDYLDS